MDFWWKALYRHLFLAQSPNHTRAIVSHFTHLWYLQPNVDDENMRRDSFGALQMKSRTRIDNLSVCQWTSSSRVNHRKYHIEILLFLHKRLTMLSHCLSTYHNLIFACSQTHVYHAINHFSITTFPLIPHQFRSHFIFRIRIETIGCDEYKIANCSRMKESCGTLFIFF